MNKHKQHDCLSFISIANQAEEASSTIPYEIACDQKHCRGLASWYLHGIFCWCKLILCLWHQLTDLDMQQLA